GLLGGLHDVWPVPRGPAGDMGRYRGRMVPCEPLAAAPRPVDRVDHRPGRGLQHCDDGAVAARRARVTVASATRWVVAVMRPDAAAHGGHPRASGAAKRPGTS